MITNFPCAAWFHELSLWEHERNAEEFEWPSIPVAVKASHLVATDGLVADGRVDGDAREAAGAGAVGTGGHHETEESVASILRRAGMNSLLIRQAT